MSTQHTPGPWFPYTSSHGLVHRPQGETEANARLIASSPELLCMLERILDAVTSLPEMPRTLCALDLEQARNAIARAKNSL